METKTYQQTKEIVEVEVKWMQVYENLHLNGIPYKDVHYYRYKRPWYSSGFSMGEVIVVRCNGHDIDRIDNTQGYAKSCKWRANHGLIIINFTQKGLMDYIKAAKNDDGFERTKLLEKYLDKDASKISKRKKKKASRFLKSGLLISYLLYYYTSYSLVNLLVSYY